LAQILFGGRERDLPKALLATRKTKTAQQMIDNTQWKHNIETNKQNCN
jgi:hypothetical protein